METYQPFIENVLAAWYVLTINNPIYAATIAIAVWLLTATFYSIRLAAIKKRKNAVEKNAAESLNTMQQQLQQSQQALAETVEQMEKAQHTAQAEAQRVLSVEQLVYQRNQQIAGTIQMLATNLDLGERPQLATEDIKAEAVWQQHEKVVANLVERLRTEQRAKAELQQANHTAAAKLAEKESLLKTLQTALDSQTKQLGNLEQALAEQKSMLQQHSDNQQAFADALKNFQPVVVTAPAQPEPAPAPQQPKPADPVPAVEATPVSQPAPHKELEELPEEPQVTAAAKIEEAPVAIPEPVQPDIVAEPAVEIAAEPPVVDRAQPAVAEKTGSLGKFKSLFGKQSDTEAQPVIEEPAVAAPVEVEPEPAAPSQSSFGKMKNLFGRQSDAEPQPVAEEPAAAAPVEAEPEPATSGKSSFGKMKNLFGKKAPPVKTEPQWEEPTPEPVVEQQPEPEAEEKAESKLKGFYSRFSSKGK